MKRSLILFSLAILAALTASAAVLQRQQQILSEKLVRLHVVANSDSSQDQQDKLMVRDAVLEIADGLDEAQLQAALPRIQDTAEACLASLGRAADVRVSLCREYFPTRLYDTFSLPAGSYKTLRITIGQGEGHNWWCVVFPSICLRTSTQELEEAAVSAGFTTEELALITEESGYVLKFKCMEWIDSIKQVFRNGPFHKPS